MRARSSARRTSSSLARMVSRAASTCSPASVARNQLLATSAAIDCRAYSKSACRRRGLRGARRPAVAHAAPEVELPGRGEDAALDARAVAGQLAAAAREEIDRRIELRARQLGVELRLLDARGADAQIGVVRDRFGDRRRQLIVAERREPVVGDRRRRRRLAPSTARASAASGSACSLMAAASGGVFSAQPATIVATSPVASGAAMA